VIVSRVLGVLAVMAIGTAAVQTWRLDRLQRDLAQAERQRAEDMREAERQARRSVEVIADDTHRALARARADAAAARSAADGLRDAASAAAAACTSTGIAAGSETTGSSGVVLADVLGSAAARAIELAAALDAAHVAGAGCQRAYDQVTSPQGRP